MKRILSARSVALLGGLGVLLSGAPALAQGKLEEILARMDLESE